MGVLQGEQARQAMARLRHRSIGEQESVTAPLEEDRNDLAADQLDVGQAG